ncbi:MAG TPA: hypothetical protein VMH05_25515 [Bryobacteraceae bacterium]|nr:hypothetical protein [Bryobacteraceae bacterium]
MLRTLVLVTVLSGLLNAQDPSFPLESISIEGSTLPKDTILGLTGFRVGAPVNKSAIEAGCMKLEESGLFQDINYRYAPGPKHGYVVTLSLSDQSKLTDAAIDIPGANEEQIWRWLGSQYPPFAHKVPDNPGAQEFLAKQIEQHAAEALGGQRLVTRLEQEFTPRARMIVSFQLENLPSIAAMNFVGQQKLSAPQLESILQKVIAGQGYTDRRFRTLVELNLRPAYEELGMYRVRFPEITAQKAGQSSLAVTVSIDEGSQFTLGSVEIAGDDLPREAMQKAANLKPGGAANWTQIQQAVWAMERPVKRLGYFSAQSRTDRVLHDDTHVLDVHAAFEKGPLYHFGNVRFTGLSPALESRARQVWSAGPGSPYDFEYPNDFVRDFSRVVDFRQFKKYEVKTQAGTGDHVIDVTVNFEPR